MLAGFFRFAGRVLFLLRLLLLSLVLLKLSLELFTGLCHLRLVGLVLLDILADPVFYPVQDGLLGGLRDEIIIRVVHLGVDEIDDLVAFRHPDLGFANRGVDRSITERLVAVRPALRTAGYAIHDAATESGCQHDSQKKKIVKMLHFLALKVGRLG